MKKSRKFNTLINRLAIVTLILSSVCMVADENALTAYAKYGDYDTVDDNFSRIKQKVYDNADILTSSQEEELEDRIYSASNNGKLDIVILTVDTISGKDPIIYAADFYEEMGFGYDYEVGTGVILLINMGERDVALAGAGMAKIYLPDHELDEIRDDITSDLSDGNYYRAMMDYIDAVEEKALDALDDREYKEAFEEWYSKDYSSAVDQDAFFEEYTPKDNFFTTFKNPVVDIVIGLIIAGVVVAILASQSKTQITVNSKSYLNQGIRLRTRQDTFTHTTTTRHKIESSSSSGGGNHRSSGGHSFSGSKGKF